MSGEALALQIGDINLQRNIIYINKTLTTDIDNQICIGKTTKTYAGQRELPIPDFLRKYIIEQIEIAKNLKNIYYLQLQKIDLLITRQLIDNSKI